MSGFGDALRDTQGEQFPSKHDRYDQTVARKVLLALQQNPVAAAQHCREQGDELGLAYVNEFHTLELGLSIASAKLRQPVCLSSLIKGSFTKAELWVTYSDLRDNWPDSPNFAMVFDRHGDKIGDLVMHNDARLQPEGEWHMTLWRSKSDGPYFVHTLPSFLTALYVRFGG